MPKTDNHNKMYINKDGKRVMRVSEVIKILAKDQLVVWANMLGLKGVKYKDELSRTANIGSLCHDVMDKYFTPGYLADIDYEEHGVTDLQDQEEASHAIDSFFAWYDKYKKEYPFNVAFTELTVIGNELGGTIDLGIQGWKDPKKVIFVDYKTGKDFYLAQFLQLAGYVSIYEEVNGPGTIEGVMICRLEKRQGKKASAWFLPREEMDPYIMCFQCMFDVAVGTRILGSTFREHVIRFT